VPAKSLPEQYAELALQLHHCSDKWDADRLYYRMIPIWREMTSEQREQAWAITRDRIRGHHD